MIRFLIQTLISIFLFISPALADSDFNKRQRFLDHMLREHENYNNADRRREQQRLNQVSNDMFICNKKNFSISVAVTSLSYLGSSGEGWYTIESGGCANIGNKANTQVYIYINDNKGKDITKPKSHETTKYFPICITERFSWSQFFSYKTPIYGCQNPIRKKFVRIEKPRFGQYRLEIVN